MSAPLVSVIIPYYAHGRHLHQAVESALRAYRGPIEVLLVDDGSVEARAAQYIDAAAALSPSVKVIRQTNQGLSAARNAGLSAASGSFVQFLDSDDMLVPGKIDLQLAQMTMQPAIAVTLSNYLLSDATGSRFWRDGDPISRFDFTLDDFLFHWERGFSLPIHVALFRREGLVEAPFEVGLKGKEDWLFWCKLAAAGHNFSYLPVFGAIYRQHPSMSKSFRLMGESFLTAARLIEDYAHPSRDAFRAASLDWHEKFYRAQIGAEAHTVAAVSPVAATAAPILEPLPAPSDALKCSEGEIAFSVVVPVFNHYDYLRECIASIVTQECASRFEVVLVDDASSDPRVAVFLAQCAAVLPNLHVLTNEKNYGIVHTQGRAAEAARGRFLVFVDCDDQLPEGALETVRQALEPGTDYLFTDRTDIDARGKTLRIARYGGYSDLKPSGDIAADLLDGMIASHLKVIRRSAFKQAGGFDPRFAGVQDWELALKLARSRAKFQYLDRALYRHRIHEASVTGEASVRQFWLTNRVRREFATAALRPTFTDDAAVSIAREALRRGRQGALEVAVFGGAAGVRISTLKQAWKAGQACLYRAAPEISSAEINLLREFNSYLDLVLVPNEQTACALVGYMWRRDALVLEGEADITA
jgi:glycosyltransferase involved in cell wall biosynthesis